GAGYEVVTAADGKQGLKLALELNPDIVVADWQMPEMDGLELCKALRRTQTGQKMFFLLLTGMQEGDRLIEAFNAGVDDFVTKPFLPRLLQARIKGGVRLVRLQRKVEKDKETMRRQVAEMGMLTRKLRSAALTDILTELPNRRYAMKRMESEWASAERTSRPLSLIMLDIDNFKSVNDTHGHDMGDVVLKATADILRSSIRQEDEICRIGGEEFIIICRNTSKLDGALVAERVRKSVEEHVFDEPGFDRGITVSLGVSERCEGVTSIEELLKASDNAVYAAKEAGRNRVCLDSDHAEDQKKSA
ncbi:MAG: diguanylate cyclase, partial [Candidatus Poseidoniia archaeon]